MKTYSEELKNSVITQMLPPRSRSVAELVKETGIPKETLYTWRSKALGQKEKEVAQQSRGREGLSSAEKFHRVVESAALNEQEKGEFCRWRGIFPEQLQGELRRKEKALAEARLMLQKKSPGTVGGARGRKLGLAERREVSALIEKPAPTGRAWNAPVRCWN
jgi:transposase-like protein